MARLSAVEALRVFRDTFGDRYNIVTVTQVAVTFVLAVLNWTAIRWWANVNLSTGTAWVSDPISYLGLGLVAFLTLGLAYLGSYFMPVRILITPLDVNAMTWGIYVFHSWVSTPPTAFDAYGYFFTLILVLVSLIFVGVLQNFLYLKATGIVGSSGDLMIKVLESPEPRDKVANALWLTARKVLRLYHRKDFDDGTAAFYGKDGEIEYYIGITPKSGDGKVESGCYLTVLDYVKARHAIWKSYDSEIFHAMLCNNLKEVFLKEFNVTDSKDANFSQAVVNEALAITGGWGERLYEAGGGFYRPLLLIAIVTIATSYFYFISLIDRNTAFFIITAIVLTQVAPSVYSRRKRIK